MFFQEKKATFNYSKDYYDQTDNKAQLLQETKTLFQSLSREIMGKIRCCNEIGRQHQNKHYQQATF